MYIEAYNLRQWEAKLFLKALLFTNLLWQSSPPIACSCGDLGSCQTHYLLLLPSSYGPDTSKNIILANSNRYYYF